MNTIHPSIPQWRGEKPAALRVTASQPRILSMRGTTYWFFPISPMCVDFSIRSIHTASSLEAVGYAANSPPCPSDPYSAGGRVFPSLLPPPGQILFRKGKKNQDKHMQELGFRHPMKINLSEVISLTRGFNKNVICIINHSSMSISLNECQKYYLQQHDLTGLEYIIWKMNT